MELANSSSLSMVTGSKVSSYHISSTFTAVLGMKLQPANQPFWVHHWLASSGVHWGLPETVTAKDTASVAKARFLI